MPEDKNKKTILIVEDDPLNMRLTVDLLEINGFNTLSCSDGYSAFETLKNGNGNGVKGIKVVFLTALVKEEEVASSGGTIGGLDYISKSTSKDKFAKRVREILSKKK